MNVTLSFAKGNRRITDSDGEANSEALCALLYTVTLTLIFMTNKTDKKKHTRCS